MLRSKDLNKEIKALEDTIESTSDEKKILKALLKGVTLVLKIFRDVRTNQVLGLRKAGVELIKPTREEDKEEEPKDTK